MNYRSWLIAFAMLFIATGCNSVTFHSLDQKLSDVRNSASFGGKSLIGTTLNTNDEQGQPQTLKIVNVEQDAQDRDLYLYTVLRQRSQTSEWQNLCQPDQNGMIQAIPLSGQWDEAGNHLDNGKITFACTNSVLVKCLRLGYKPWQQVSGQSLRNYHQACTRMLRADYCGNGIAHTQEGTPIDVYDRLHIQRPTPDSNMVFEAAWSPSGAVWIDRTRFPDTLDQLQQECPKKLQTLLQTGTQEPIAASNQSSSEALIFNHSFDRVYPK